MFKGKLMFFFGQPDLFFGESILFLVKQLGNRVFCKERTCRKVILKSDVKKTIMFLWGRARGKNAQNDMKSKK
jgi:MarR-like DNA-binding transcriptional regulator SgrR of sgrS sRNA